MRRTREFCCCCMDFAAMLIGGISSRPGLPRTIASLLPISAAWATAARGSSTTAAISWAEVRAILEMIGPKAVTLVGHSFGGRIAVFAAHEYPATLAARDRDRHEYRIRRSAAANPFRAAAEKDLPRSRDGLRALSVCAGRAADFAAHHAASCGALDQAAGRRLTWKFDEKPIGSVVGSRWRRVSCSAKSICRWTSSPGNSARWCRRHWRIESARLCAMGADPSSYRPPTIMFPWISPWRWLLCCARCFYTRRSETALRAVTRLAGPWRPAAARHVWPGTSRR